MNIDLDNFDLIVNTIKNPKQIQRDLILKLEEEIEEKEWLMEDGYTQNDVTELQNLKYKLKEIRNLIFDEAIKEVFIKYDEVFKNLANR